MAVSRRAPRHKFSAVRTELDGQSFPSKLEARLYAQLKAEQASGRVLFFLRQVPFHMPGGGKLVVDFQVFYADGTVAFLDAKGLAMPDWIAKVRIVEALYPVKIETWTG